MHFSLSLSLLGLSFSSLTASRSRIWIWRKVNHSLIIPPYMQKPGSISRIGLSRIASTVPLMIQRSRGGRGWLLIICILWKVSSNLPWGTVSSGSRASSLIPIEEETWSIPSYHIRFSLCFCWKNASSWDRQLIRYFRWKDFLVVSCRIIWCFVLFNWRNKYFSFSFSFSF